MINFKKKDWKKFLSDEKPNLATPEAIDLLD
jgi:hypothetical protein